MEFSRPEYWSGYPFPSPGDLPNPGIKPRSPALQADSLPAEPQVAKSCLNSFATPWNVAHQAPLPMGFPRQEYWSGLPLPFPGGLPDPGIKPKSLLLGRQILHH